jgi:hypothetical protein
LQPRRRQRRKILTDAMVTALKEEGLNPDPGQVGHYIRITPSGGKAFYAVARDAHGKQRWVKLGKTGDCGVEESRQRAREVRKRLRAGQEPFPPPPIKRDSVGEVVAQWLKRHVEKNNLRAGYGIKRLIDRHILVAPFRDRPFAALKRSEISKLLDDVEDNYTQILPFGFYYCPFSRSGG